jgi:RNA methyltransferase, TrmH family
MLSKSEIKYIQSLGHKKSRDEAGVFLTEGVKLVDEVLDQFAGHLIRLYATATYLEKRKKSVPEGLFTEVSELELSRISQLQTPNQALAIVRKFEEVIHPVENDQWLLALDSIRDPGNMGTIIRLADWFGISTLICSPDCVDFYNSKVVQASMGSILRVRHSEQDLPVFLKQQERPVFAAVLDGVRLDEVQFPESGVLVIGNESTGIEATLLNLIDHKIMIPSFGKAESLNAAIATGIFLWELKRSRS